MKNKRANRKYPNKSKKRSNRSFNRIKHKLRFFENKGKEDPYKLEINEVPKALIGKKISGLCSYYVG